MDLSAIVMSWFGGVSDTLKPAVLAAATNLALYLLGFIAIIVTAILARGTALATKRTELKLQIYERLIKAHDEAADASIAASGYVSGFLTMLEVRRDLPDGVVWAPPPERFPMFQERHSRLTDALSELHGMLESWQIIDRRLDIFRMGFAVQSDAILRAHSDMTHLLIQVMPAENPASGSLFPWVTPSPDRIDALRPLVDHYAHEVHLTSAYVGDLRIEMQRLLLRGIFRGRPQRRDAPDPDQFAIRIDRHRQIRAYFLSTPFVRSDPASGLSSVHWGSIPGT
ncbi:MAG: hypothetical protein EON59_07580 [Alphaproteobacteria bacterium]|nr:MAG: hypothetical protein EON59_07580 [Alphaproteobacteria bacterium]